MSIMMNLICFFSFAFANTYLYVHALPSPTPSYSPSHPIPAIEEVPSLLPSVSPSACKDTEGRFVISEITEDKKGCAWFHRRGFCDVEAVINSCPVICESCITIPPPTASPSSIPSITFTPTSTPSSQTTATANPSTSFPTVSPSLQLSISPTSNPSSQTTATAKPSTSFPTVSPSLQLSISPTLIPSASPTDSTDKPSVTASKLPSVQPTKGESPPSEKPSLVPTLAKESSEPSGLPSFSPSLCEDDPTYRHKDVPFRSCKWVGATPERRELLCSKRKIATRCRLSCGMCQSHSITPSPSSMLEPCADDPTYRHQDLPKRSCDWVGAIPTRRDNFCAKMKISSRCKLTCGVCSNDDVIEDDEPSCFDNGDFIFKKDKTCESLSESDKIFNKFCKSDNWKNVRENCRFSCGLCEDIEEDDTVDDNGTGCTDNKAFIFKKNKTCETLSGESDKVFDKFCKSDNWQNVQRNCPVTCKLSPCDNRY